MDLGKDVLVDYITTALTNVADETPKLDLNRVGELSVVFRIGLYLAKTIEVNGIKIDSEYAIDLSGDKKEVALSEKLKLLADKLGRNTDDGRLRVRPDLIVHERNSNKHNLAVIEIKFEDSSKVEREYVEEKLKAFQDAPFEYQNAILVLLPRIWSSFADKRTVKIITRS